MTKNSDRSFIQKIWDKKVPQYLGTYFAVGFGLLQFVEFITKRYNLSEILVDKFLLVWLTLVPAMFMVIYFGGELKFKSTNLKWPKFFVISNILLAILLGSFLFNGKISTESVNIELKDEKGDVIVAAVPKLNMVKTVANFQFKNINENEDDDWYGIAFSQLLQLNLNQRSEFYALSVYSLNRFHDALGLPSFVVPNIGMQREIARKSRNDYFTNITYSIKNGVFEFRGSLFKTKDGKDITTLLATDKNPYNAIDSLKEQIFNNIPNTLKNKDDQVNIPASSLITNNIEALKYHTESRVTFYENPSALKETLELEKKALELDVSCAECHYYVGDVLYGLGQTDESINSFKLAIKYGQSLPKRMQFDAKTVFYRTTNNMPAYYKLQELRRRMFPYEFEAYEHLVNSYIVNYGIGKAKELIQEAINNGNVERGLLALYKLQLENEEYIEAITTLDRYYSEFSDRDKDRLKYVDVYEKQGKLDNAKDILLEEEALDPLNTSIQIRLATLDFRNQKISLSNKRINTVLQQATTLTDSLLLLWTKSYFLESSGQIKFAFKTIEDYEKYAADQIPINRVIVKTFMKKASMNQSIDKSGNIEGLLSNLIKYSPELGELYRCLTNLKAIQGEYNLNRSIDEFSLSCNEEFEKFGDGYSSYFEILLAYKNKDYDLCIELLESDNGKMKKTISDKYFLSNIYIKGGNYDIAKKIIKKEIDQKTSIPIYYYQMANLLKDESPKEAKGFLNIALKYWENADFNYIPFQRAIALSKKLEGYEGRVKL